MDELEEYFNTLIEQGAYRVVGYDSDGDRLIEPVPEVLAEVAPELWESHQIDGLLEATEALYSLEQKGLVERVDDDEFRLTPLGELWAEEIEAGLE